MQIDTLYQEIDESRKHWSDLYTFLINGKYDINSPRAMLDGLTVDQLDRRVTLVIETFFAIKPVDQKSVNWLVLSTKSAELASSFTNLKNHASSASAQIRPHCQDGTNIRSPNSDFYLTFFTGESQVGELDLNAFFTQIHLALIALVTSVSSLLPLCKAGSVSDLSMRAQATADLVRQIEALRNDAKKLLKAVDQSMASAAEKEELIRSLHGQAESSLQKLQTLQQQGATDSGSVTALIEKIKLTGNNADSLEQQIDTYSSKFDAFQAVLDARNADFVKFETNTRLAVDASEKRDKEINRLTELADFMIRGATTAGLAKSMEDARARYEGRMNGARIGFYCAVALLVLSAIPLVGHLLPGLFATWFPGVDVKADSSPYSLISKIALLLPATWLTAFFTKSYADFFHLEREYAHKAALAMSVDGFKRQAEKYQEEITAEVFMEIRTNPAHRLGTDPASHPLYDVLAKVVRKALAKDGDPK